MNTEKDSKKISKYCEKQSYNRLVTSQEVECFLKLYTETVSPQFGGQETWCDWQFEWLPLYAGPVTYPRSQEGSWDGLPALDSHP